MICHMPIDGALICGRVCPGCGALVLRLPFTVFFSAYTLPKQESCTATILARAHLTESCRKDSLSLPRLVSLPTSLPAMISGACLLFCVLLTMYIITHEIATTLPPLLTIPMHAMQALRQPPIPPSDEGANA
eukprot:scaffold161069_cov18-Tisochrysis_lutea.AAC.3